MVLWIALSIVLTGAEELRCVLEGSPELDLSRWSVMTVPSLKSALQRKSYGLLRVSVSDGNETFEYLDSLVHGVPWNQPLSQHAYEYFMERVRLRRGDIVVATYPKCGTTWVEQLVLLLLHGSDSASKMRPALQNTFSPERKMGKFWLEPLLASGSLFAKKSGNHTIPDLFKKFDQYPSPRVVKTHAPFHMLMGVGPNVSIEALETTGAKVVYVARNAKDASLSHFFHLAPTTGKRRMPMDAWAALYLSGAVGNGSPAKHFAGWCNAAASSSSILYLTYEDLKRNPKATVRRLASHLGFVNTTDKEIDKVIAAASFSAMSPKEKRRPRRTRSRHASRYSVAPGATYDDNLTMSNQFREGIIGAWRRHFNIRLSQQFDQMYAGHLRQATESPFSSSLDNMKCNPPAKMYYGCDRWM